MKTFQIELCRTGYGFATATVEANTMDEARRKALEQAPSMSFSENSSEYDIAE